MPDLKLTLQISWTVTAMTCQNNTANGKKEYQCCIPNEKSYVKCDICSATRYIENDIYTEVKQHTQHDMTTRHRDMPAEIQRLQQLKGVASVHSWRAISRIFAANFWYRVTVCWKCSCFICEIESSVYKRRRRLLPLLPIDASDVDAVWIRVYLQFGVIEQPARLKPWRGGYALYAAFGWS